MSSPLPFVHALADVPTSALLSLLSAAPAPTWQASLLYESKTDTKLLDPERRSSQFREFRGKAAAPLFDHVELLVLPLCDAASPAHRFSLVRSDASHIRYSEGGFFKRHKDYCSVASPAVVEYTLIISLAGGGEAPVGGGTTVWNAGEKRTFGATTEHGGALLFRKDLEHAGETLEKGTKEVLTLNLWAFDAASSAGVLHVTFDGPQAAASGDAGDELRAFATDKSCAIPLSAVLAHPDTMLAGKARFHQQQHPEATIVPAHLAGMTYEEFEPAMRFYLGARVSADMLERSGSALNFLCIPPQQLLMDIAYDPEVDEKKEAAAGDGGGGEDAAAADDDDEEEEEEEWEDVSLPDELDGMPAQIALMLREIPLHAVDRMSAAMQIPREELTALIELLQSLTPAQMDLLAATVDDKGADPNSWESRIRRESDLEVRFPAAKEPTPKKSKASFSSIGDIILCASKARTDVVAARAKELGAAYLPFQVCLVEGMITGGGDAWVQEDGPDDPDNYNEDNMYYPVVEAPLNPVWMSIGDYDNIVGYKNMIASSRPDFSNYGFFKTRDEASLEATLPDELVALPPNSNFVAARLPRQKDYGSTKAFGLRIASRSPITPELITGLCMDGEDRAHSCAWPDGALVYLPDAPPDDTADEEVTLFPESKFYHIDGAGKSAFTKEEADRTFKRIQQMQFMERLCDSDLLNSVPFVLPQVDDVEIEAAFCNEQVYGKLNLLFVSGIVKLD